MSTKGKTIYNNGIDEIRLKPGEPIPIGFTKGRIKWKIYNNGVNEIRLTPNKPVPVGFVHGAIKAPNKGKKAYINNSGKITYKGKDEIIPEGYIEGGICPTKGCTLYNNGAKSRFFKDNEVIPEEFMEGGLTRGHHYNNGVKGVITKNKPDGFINGRLYQDTEFRHNCGEIIYSLIKDKDKFKEFLENIPYEDRTYYRVKDELNKLDSNNKLSWMGLIRSIKSAGLHDLIKLLNGVNKSRYETEIIEFIKDIKSDINLIQGYRPQWLKFNSNYPKELDIYLPEYNLAIEFNGIVFHDDSHLNLPDYHAHKTKLCRDKGIKLIHIFEFNWTDSNYKNKIKDYIKYMILNKSIVNSEIEVKSVDKITINKFLDKYYLSDRSLLNDINYGIINNKRLYSIISFECLDNSNYIISAYCSNPEFEIKNGFEILFNKFIADYTPNTIKVYCDNNILDDSHYLLNNFKLIDSKVTYTEINSRKIYDKFIKEYLWSR